MKENYLFMSIVMLPFMLFYLMILLGMINGFISRLSGGTIATKFMPKSRDLVLMSLVLDVVVIFENLPFLSDPYNGSGSTISIVFPLILFMIHMFTYIIVFSVENKKSSIPTIKIYSLMLGVFALFTNAWTLSLYMFQY